MLSRESDSRQNENGLQVAAKAGFNRKCCKQGSISRPGCAR
jgi:hypothetical protein